MAITTPAAGRLTQGQENFFWLVGDRLVRLFSGVLVGLLVARYLGPGRFGLLAYAGSVVALLLPVAELGVDAVVRRRLITAPEEAARWLGLVWRLRLVTGAMLVLALGLWLALSGEEPGAAGLILILALGLLQPAGMTADLWLQANLRAKRATVASWAALAIGALGRLALITTDAGLHAFAWIMVGEGALNCLLVWIAARQAGLPRLASGAKVGPARELLTQSWPLLLSGLTVTLYMRIDLVMLRQMAGNASTGTYAAAVRLSELWYFVPGALASSVLPGLLRHKSAGPGAYVRAMQRYYDFSAALAYAAALITCLFAGPLVDLAYGAEFGGATVVLRWHAWAVVFVFLGVARGQFLVNENLTVFYLLTTTLGAGLNIALNYWLIPIHGPLGAAWATLAAYGLAAWGASWLHPRVRGNAAMQTRALLVPLLGWRHLLSRR